MGGFDDWRSRVTGTTITREGSEGRVEVLMEDLENAIGTGEEVKVLVCRGGVGISPGAAVQGDMAALAREIWDLVEGGER